VKGRKRHLLVDTNGFILAAKVLPADIQDRDGGQTLLAPLHDQLPRLQHIWADSAYAGDFVEWVKVTLGWTVEIVQHWWTKRGGAMARAKREGQAVPAVPTGFVLLKWRWIIERTNAWLLTNRRLAVEYDLLPSSSEARIYLAMSRILVRRLVQP
jgi:transposase